MQSIAPNIIKHFIPYEFSKNVLDLQVVPKKMTRQKDENPLQNMKLRSLEREQQRELVLTYKNKSNPLYRSKKTIHYHHLFRQLEEEHQKRNIIREHMKEAGKDEEEDQSAVRGSKGSINNININQLNEERRQLMDRGYHSHRKLHTDQVKQRANMLSGRQTGEERKRPLTHRLYSSINFREYNQRIIADYSKHSQLQHSPQNQLSKQSVKKLKIRGRQAPEREMVDHLRRSSTSSSDLVISIHRFDRK